jgi:hypothetical protein
MATFTPDDEPYLGRESVHHFDQVIVAAMAEQHRIGPWTRSHPLSEVQIAASQLIPGAISIALSTRELVRQGYLLSALILTRPLLERVATLIYLIRNPRAVTLWRQGWPHNTRPTLGTRMEALLDEGKPNRPSRADLKRILERYNSLIHGDPAAALHGAILLDDGRPGFTLGRDVSSPARADEVCWEVAMWLVILDACSRLLFPPA